MTQETKALLKERMPDGDFRIVEAFHGVMDEAATYRYQTIEADLKTNRVKADIEAEVLSRADPVTNKALYTNDKTRDAATLRALSDNDGYQEARFLAEQCRFNERLANNDAEALRVALRLITARAEVESI